MRESQAQEQLALAGRLVVEKGLVVGSGGNLSARIDDGSGFTVTRSGTWLDRLDDSSFVAFGVHDDAPPAGSEPSVEWRLHQYTYRSRPDVNAIVHLHPQLLVLLDAAGEPIRKITTDHAYYLGDIGHVGYHRPGTEALAIDAAETSRDHDVMILRRHGCSTLGGEVSQALRLALNLDEAAELTYRSILLGCGPEIAMPLTDQEELNSV